MTPFSALQSLCGLSNREAANFLGITESAVNKFRSGAKTARSGHLRDLRRLWTLIDQAAVDRAEEMMGRGIFEVEGWIEIGYPADDHEAVQLGLPCVGTWRQFLARLIDELMLIRAGSKPSEPSSFDPARIRLVPRGSTLATAAAIEEPAP